jgi:SAM-dependent methyltransferase
MDFSHLRGIPYLPNQDLAEFAAECQYRHPRLYNCLAFDRFSVEELRAIYQDLTYMPSHFEGKDLGGRGDAYRTAQRRNPLIRATGICALFELIHPKNRPFSQDHIVLDVLGGNGTLTRTITAAQKYKELPTIFTSDASSAMILDALSQSFPAVRQPAQNLLFGDSTVDGFIFAYGTHHIPPQDRQEALQEAHRVLRRDGWIVLQDFEEHTPTARWYSEVLDKYTLTGHRCEHFTRESMQSLFENSGLEDISVGDVYDPFIVVGDSAEGARIALLEHLVDLFSLEKLAPVNGCRDLNYWDMVEELVRPYARVTLNNSLLEGTALSEFTVRPVADKFVAEFPRVALVAVGRRVAANTATRERVRASFAI